MKFTNYDDAVTALKRLVPGASIKENSIVLPKNADIGLSGWRALDAIRIMSNKAIVRDAAEKTEKTAKKEKKEETVTYKENVRVGEPAPGITRGFRLGNMAHFDKNIEPEPMVLDMTNISDNRIMKLVVKEVLKYRK